MLILASQSPRRKEILSMLGYEFVTRPADADETIPAGTHPADAVKMLAERKALAVDAAAEDVVIGSDTVVALDGLILGKPVDASDARAMLHRLSGATHTVYTGVCIKQSARIQTFCSASQVTFYELTDREIDEYIATGEPMDKAGAYGIQGKGLVLIRRLSGDFYAVMGLPAAETARALRDFGVFAKNS